MEGTDTSNKNAEIKLPKNTIPLHTLFCKDISKCWLSNSWRDEMNSIVPHNVHPNGETLLHSGCLNWIILWSQQKTDT